MEEQGMDPSSAATFQIPREPAIVINGVPCISSGVNLDPCNSASGVVAEAGASTDFGEWLEGREVQKLFGEKYYSGLVTEYDKENGWFRVVYEDGDFEDLDRHELEGVLLPLDIMVPLKALALKTIKRNKKTNHKSARNTVAPQSRPVKYVAWKGRSSLPIQDAASTMKPENS